MANIKDFFYYDENYGNLKTTKEAQVTKPQTAVNFTNRDANDIMAKLNELVTEVNDVVNIYVEKSVYDTQIQTLTADLNNIASDVTSITTNYVTNNDLDKALDLYVEQSVYDTEVATLQGDINNVASDLQQVQKTYLTATEAGQTYVTQTAFDNEVQTVESDIKNINDTISQISTITITDAATGQVQTLSIDNVVTGLVNDVDVVQQDLVTAQDDIQQVTDQALTAQTLTLTQAWTGLETRVDTVEGDVKTIGNTVNTLVNQNLDGRIVTLTQNIDGLGSDLDAVEGDITAINNVINVAVTTDNFAEVIKDYITIDSQTGDITMTINNVTVEVYPKATVDDIVDDVDQLEKKDADLQKQIDATTGLTDEQKQLIDEAQKAISQAQTDIGALQTDLDATKTDVAKKLEADDITFDMSGNVITLTVDDPVTSQKVAMQVRDVATEGYVQGLGYLESKDLLTSYDLSSSSSSSGEKTVVLEFTDPLTGKKASDSIKEIAKYSWTVDQFDADRKRLGTIEDAGYQDATQVDTAIEAKGYAHWDDISIGLTTYTDKRAKVYLKREKPDGTIDYDYSGYLPTTDWVEAKSYQTATDVADGFKTSGASSSVVDLYWGDTKVLDNVPGYDYVQQFQTASEVVSQLQTEVKAIKHTAASGGDTYDIQVAGTSLTGGDQLSAQSYVDKSASRITDEVITEVDKRGYSTLTPEDFEIYEYDAGLDDGRSKRLIGIQITREDGSRFYTETDWAFAGFDWVDKTFKDIDGRGYVDEKGVKDFVVSEGYLTAKEMQTDLYLYSGSYGDGKMRDALRVYDPISKTYDYAYGHYYPEYDWTNDRFTVIEGDYYDLSSDVGDVQLTLKNIEQSQFTINAGSNEGDVTVDFGGAIIKGNDLAINISPTVEAYFNAVAFKDLKLTDPTQGIFDVDYAILQDGSKVTDRTAPLSFNLDTIDTTLDLINEIIEYGLAGAIQLVLDKIGAIPVVTDMTTTSVYGNITVQTTKPLKDFWDSASTSATSESSARLFTIDALENWMSDYLHNELKSLSTSYFPTSITNQKPVKKYFYYNGSYQSNGYSSRESQFDHIKTNNCPVYCYMEDNGQEIDYYYGQLAPVYVLNDNNYNRMFVGPTLNDNITQASVGASASDHQVYIYVSGKRTDQYILCDDAGQWDIDTGIRSTSDVWYYDYD